MKGIDWQLVAFVTVSLYHDHWVYTKLPRLYFYEHRNIPPREKK